MTIGPLRPAVSVSTQATGFILDTSVLNTGTLGSAQYVLTDISSRVTDLSVRRGRDNITDQLTPGSAVITIKNQDYARPLSYFHLGQLVTVSAFNTATSATTALMYGTLEDAQEIIEPGTGERSTRLVVTEYLKQLEETPVAEVPDGSPASADVHSYLSILLSGWTHNIDSNAGTGLKWWTPGTVLNRAQAAELVDAGAFFQTRLGVLRYISRNNLFAASRYVTPTYVLDETDTAGRAPVGAVQRNRNPDRVRNHVILTNSNELRVARQNDVSVGTVGVRAVELTTLHSNNTETGIVAQHYANLWSALESDIGPITYSAARNAVTAQLVTLDLYDYVDLTTFNPAGAGADVTTECTVDAIAHQWSHDSGWLTTLKLNSAIPATAA